MCRDPTIANVWKCRILIGIEYEESDSPQFTVIPIKDINERKKSEQFTKILQPFQIQMMFGSVISTPEESKDYNLMI